MMDIKAAARWHIRPGHPSGSFDVGYGCDVEADARSLPVLDLGLAAAISDPLMGGKLLLCGEFIERARQQQQQQQQQQPLPEGLSLLQTPAQRSVKSAFNATAKIRAQLDLSSLSKRFAPRQTSLQH